jgi:hypothetical protein
MSPPDSRAAARAPSAEPAPEKRGKRRQRVFLAGKVSHGGFSTDCTIRDLSDLGARIHVPSVIGLPDEVSLLILREGIVLRCKRIWTRAPLYGLTFIEAEDIQTAKRAQHVALRRLWHDWTSKQNR